MNKPVAWIPKGMTLAKPKDLTDCIPLYTHPVKELTDEEIREFITVFPMIFNHLDLMAFAKAILRKAQEK